MTNKKWLERGGGDVATELPLSSPKLSKKKSKIKTAIFTEENVLRVQWMERGGRCCGGKGLFD
jgi:hypothetical protein